MSFQQVLQWRRRASVGMPTCMRTHQLLLYVQTCQQEQSNDQEEKSMQGGTQENN